MIYFCIGVLVGLACAIIFISLMFKDEIQFIPRDQIPPEWDFYRAKGKERALLSGNN